MKRKTSFIPVQNDLNKAIAFANSLDNNNITQRLKIKQENLAKLEEAKKQKEAREKKLFGEVLT